MIRVSIFYPNSEGKRFDAEYYIKKHIPLVKEKYGDACKNIEVDIGIGSTSGSSALYKAMCHLLFESMEDFQTACAPIAKDLKSDMQNFTEIQAITQISEAINL